MDLSSVNFESMIEAGCSVNYVMRGIPAGVSPVWLEVPDELAEQLVVTDVKVGRDSQLSSTGAVPLSLFARSSPRDELLLEPVGLDGEVIVSATNVSPRKSLLCGRVIFSEDSTRLARYRRARLVGLGVTRLPPLGNLSVVVEPSRCLSPDRLYVPRQLLEKADVEGFGVYNFDVAGGHYDQVDAASPDYLRREKLEGDGLFHLEKIREVGRGRCLVVRFRNRTEEEVLVTGAVLGGDPLP